mgnify:CR=1 FL=1
MARRIAPLLLLSLASTLGTLLVIEGVFRAFGIEGHYPAPRVDRVIPGCHTGQECPEGAAPIADGLEPTEEGFVPFSTIISTYASDPRGYFDPGHEVSHAHNSAGWRDQEHDVVKEEGTLRILGLGDSYLWGQGVHQGDRVLDLLQGSLGAHDPSRRVETINTARPGVNTFWQASTLQARGLAYDPDLVILFFVLNDVEQNVRGPVAMVEFLTDYRNLYQQHDRLSAHSQLWGWARQRYLTTARARQYVTDCVASFHEHSWKWELTTGALNEIQAQLEARGIPLLMVVFPFFVELDGDYPFASIHEVVQRHAEQRGIPLLDLREAYSRFHGPELWVHETDQHPNEIAHRVAADAVHGYLVTHPELLGRGR